jgi:hypothetical protein
MLVWMSTPIHVHVSHQSTALHFKTASSTTIDFYAASLYEQEKHLADLFSNPKKDYFKILCSENSQIYLNWIYVTTLWAC